MPSRSVVSLLGLGLTLPCKVICVVLLCVPAPIRWVRNVVAPAVRLGELDGVAQASELHLQVVEGVLGAVGPPHEWGLVAAPVVHLDDPVLSDRLIAGVAVDVLALGHVNASNSAAHLLGGPGGHPLVRAE